MEDFKGSATFCLELSPALSNIVFRGPKKDLDRFLLMCFGSGMCSIIPVDPLSCSHAMIRPIDFLIVVFLVMTCLGCDEPQEIRQYRVAKSRSDLGDIGQRRIAAPSSVARDSRMVVAISERSDATWFFKITGTTAAVDATRTQWTAILSELEFDENEKPKWTVPENWISGPPQSMRFATLLTSVPGQGQVEMSISNLGPGQDLLSNVNRWRGQLGLEAISAEELQLQRLTSSAGELQLFDETGRSSQPMNAGPLDADLKYDIPAGWTQGTTNPIVKVRLTKGAEAEALQITVTQLPADANQWIPNALRWANQVGMDVDSDFLEKNATDVNVDQLPGKQIRLIPDDVSLKIAILGVMLVREDLAWFFKMTGDRNAVADNEKTFDEFLNSFRFQ